ncbi:MAG: GGDEF domain-containing protein [Hahellaceae bacterium]|nr:GGDEF domain-containing protein [Hahellaceae bacterium]
MLVREVMKAEQATVTKDCPIHQALSIMVDEGASCLVVTEHGRPKGIVTEKDVVRIFAKCLGDETLPGMPVSMLMTPSPICIDLDATCRSALIFSRSLKVRHLPVVDSEGRLCGLVTQNHLLDAYARLIDENAELSQSLETLRELSLEDPLMRIGNRRAMEVALASAEAEFRRCDRPYSVALIDIDHFKCFNDTYGHPAGDKALKDVAEQIKRRLRKSDHLFRYGGEELLVLMLNTGVTAAERAGERIREGVSQLAIPNEKTERGILTISVGVASHPADCWGDLVGHADKALYRAKVGGRNRTESAQ